MAVQFKMIVAATILVAAGIVFVPPAEAAYRAKRHRVTAVPSQQIACTVAGCMPIPAA
jgi:hypothetical protein